MDGGEELNVLHNSLSLLYYRCSFESTIFIKLIPAATGGIVPEHDVLSRHELFGIVFTLFT